MQTHPQFAPVLGDARRATVDAMDESDQPGGRGDGPDPRDASGATTSRGGTGGPDDARRVSSRSGARFDVSREPTKRYATHADIEALPEGVNGEIVAGDLWVTPRPASPHAVASSQALHDLLGMFDRGRGGPGGWHILHEPELHLGDDVLVPDIGGWRVERMPTIPSVSAFTLHPDWVCEFVSPSTARLDRAAKVPRYHLHGVEWVWVVDPLAFTLEVLHRSDAGYVIEQTFQGAESVRARPFDAVEIEIDAWWLRRT